MPDSFLSALVDSSGSSYLFGKREEGHKSIFDFQAQGVQQVSKEKYTNIYSGHALRPVNNFPIQRHNVAPDWFFLIVLIVLATFAWIRVHYNRFFVQMIQAFMNSNLANQIVRDENIFIQRASVYLSVVFNLIGALLLYLISVYYNWSLGEMGKGFDRFVLFLIIITAAYASKFLILKICGWLFEQEREMATYVFHIFLINNVLGIILLPFVCLLAYNESISGAWLITLPLIFAALALCWRIFRGLQIGIGSSASPLYLFLYLCTLEIAPLMVLLRIAVQ